MEAWCTVLVNVIQDRHSSQADQTKEKETKGFCCMQGNNVRQRWNTVAGHSLVGHQKKSFTCQKAILNLMVQTELMKPTTCKMELNTLIIWHGAAVGIWFSKLRGPLMLPVLLNSQKHFYIPTCPTEKNITALCVQKYMSYNHDLLRLQPGENRPSLQPLKKNPPLSLRRDRCRRLIY